MTRASAMPGAKKNGEVRLEYGIVKHHKTCSAHSRRCARRKKMTYLSDDVARILASPIPRRQAFKLVGGALAGAFLSSIGIQRASAAACNPACKKNEQCCPGGPGGSGSPFCANQSQICCHGTTCPPGQLCCSTRQGDGHGNVGSYCANKGHGCSASEPPD